MKTLVKQAIKQALRSAGYELRKIPSAKWSNTDGKGGGFEMMNRHYRPKSPRYRQSIWGDDQRLKYLVYFLDVRGLRVLELGPLEGYFSIILEKMGVRETVAVEGRPDNFRKCLETKTTYGLDRTTFVLGNIETLATGREHPKFNGTFDLVFCVGVLYHLPDPGAGLAWFRRQAKTLFLGTHIPEDYWQPASLYTYLGKSYRAMEWREGGLADPMSGMSPISMLPYEADLIRLIHDAGYERVSVLGYDIQNKVPHIAILAE